MLKTSWGVILNWQRDGIGDWKDSFHLHILWSMNSPLGNFSRLRVRFTPPGLSEEDGMFNLSSTNIPCSLALEVSEMFQHWETLSQTGFSLVCFLPGGFPLIFSLGASCCKPEIPLLAGCARDRTCSAASLTFAAPSLLWLSFASRPIPCRQKSHTKDTITIWSPLQFLTKSGWFPWQRLLSYLEAMRISADPCCCEHQISVYWAWPCPQPVIPLNGAHRNAGNWVANFQAVLCN